jgi:SNF2 family DNA or RNA helicase
VALLSQMGLGKTIEVLALILLNPFVPKRAPVLPAAMQMQLAAATSRYRRVPLF